jgi:hypothetical protein
MHFSIRDLFWLTLVVSMCLGWWMSYQAVDARRLEAVTGPSAAGDLRAIKGRERPASRDRKRPFG